MDDVVVKEVPDQRVAAVHVHATFDRVGEEVQGAFETLGRTVGAPSGMPFLINDAIDRERAMIDVDVCFPVSGAVPAHEDVHVLDVRGGRVASTIHRGPYDDVGRVYEELEGWLAAHREHHAGPPREIYLNDPSTGEQPLTEIQMPIRAEGVA